MCAQRRTVSAPPILQLCHASVPRTLPAVEVAGLVDPRDFTGVRQHSQARKLFGCSGW